jgi:hypothetical protein
MGKRRSFTGLQRHLALGGCLILGVVVAGHVLAVELPTLEARLKKGLQARTPAEMAFLDRVVESVEDRELPERLVDRVFFWARKKADEQEGSKRRRPMIYFQPAMTRLALRFGVDLG